jgi:hypothetical protein
MAEPLDFRPEPEAMLSLLWVGELAEEVQRFRLGGTDKAPHRVLVARMLRLTAAEQLAAVCRQLRARDAVWRADPPINDAPPVQASL